MVRLTSLHFACSGKQHEGDEIVGMGRVLKSEDYTGESN